MPPLGSISIGADPLQVQGSNIYPQGMNFDGLSASYDDWNWQGAAGSFVNTWSNVGGTIQFLTADQVSNRNAIARYSVATAGTSASLRRTSGLARALASGNWAITWIINLQALSNGTDDYTLRPGIGDQNTTEFQDGVYFEYNHALNSGNWTAVCAASAVRTKVDTGIAVASATWYTLTATGRDVAAPITFYVNNVQAAQVSTNIPTGNVGFAIQIRKNLGAGTINVSLDLMRYAYTFQAAR